MWTKGGMWRGMVKGVALSAGMERCLVGDGMAGRNDKRAK